MLLVICHTTTKVRVQARVSSQLYKYPDSSNTTVCDVNKHSLLCTVRPPKQKLISRSLMKMAGVLIKCLGGGISILILHNVLLSKPSIFMSAFNNRFRDVCMYIDVFMLVFRLTYLPRCPAVFPMPKTKITLRGSCDSVGRMSCS